MNRFGVINLLVAIGLIASVSSAPDCASRPPRTNLKECCPHDNLLTNELVEKCKSLLENGETASLEGSESVEGPGGPPGGHGHHGHHGHHGNHCFFECALNGTEIFKDNDVNGEIDASKMKNYLSKVLSETPDFVQVVQNAFETCAKKGKEMRATMEKEGRPAPPSPPPGENWCKPCSHHLLKCVQIETMLNCPTSAWKNDDACNTSRDYIKACPREHKPHGRPPM